MTVTPSGGTLAVGDVLTCNSYYPATRYRFSNVIGGVIDDNTVTLSKEGAYSFICTARVKMDRPCSASFSVSGTAVGKEEISKDRFGKRKKNRIKKEMTVYKIIITS